MDRINQVIVDWTREQEEKFFPQPRIGCRVIIEPDMERHRREDEFVGLLCKPSAARKPKGLMGNLADAFFAYLHNAVS